MLLFARSQEDLIAAGIALAIIFLVSFPVHEFAHALAAYRLGDGTAKLFGRLTLDPRAHFDPLGALLLALVGFGWAKPTPVNPLNLSGGRSSEALVSVAGPISNFVLAAAAALPVRYILMTDMDVPFIVIQVLLYFILINVILMIFNLIPIPPLDGSKVLFALMDRQTEYRWRPVLEQYGFVLLFAVIFLPRMLGGSGPVDFIFEEVAGPLIELLIGERLF